MTNQDVTRNIWRNSISNYVCTGVRMICGLLMFRMLFQYLTKEEFGFWAILWSVFGYGILLDFGFGFTAEKRVAQLSVREEWDHLSRILSTIFFLYLAIGILMIVTILLTSGHMINLFHVTPANQGRFQEILVLFSLEWLSHFRSAFFLKYLLASSGYT